MRVMSTNVFSNMAENEAETWLIVTTKNWPVCGKLMSRQIVTLIGPNKTSADLQCQLVWGSLYTMASTGNSRDTLIIIRDRRDYR